MHRLSGLVASVALALAALTGCGGSDLVLPSDGVPAELQIRGDGQEGAVGAPLPDSLEVSVLDSRGEPLPGQTVTPASSITGADGLASTIWTLGTGAGSQSATATSDGMSGSPVTFTAEARAGSPDELVRESGDGQSAAPGTELPAPLIVRLVDERGNGVPNRAVSWVVATGG